LTLTCNSAFVASANFGCGIYFVELACD